REQMTRMEMKFVDVQILAAGDKVDYEAIRRSLEQMEDAAARIKKVNPSDALVEPLKKLTDQLATLKKDARSKHLDALKGHMDLVFETCFKCHQAHAPIM